MVLLKHCDSIINDFSHSTFVTHELEGREGRINNILPPGACEEVTPLARAH